ncbi:MAG: hypothetical protein ACOCX2_01790 [Armatimonadota bacterium]
MMRLKAAIAVLLLTAGALAAQSAPDMSMSVEPESVTIGETFALTVTFTLPADHEAIVPGEDAELGGAEVRSVERSVEALDDGAERHTAVYTVALWEVGEVVLTGPAVAARGPDGAVSELERDEATVTVRSVLPEGAEEIRDIRGPKEIPLRWHHYVLAALPLLALGGLIVLLVWWLRSRRRADAPEEAAAPPLPPAEEALTALQKLEDDDLVGQGLIKEHYVRLSWILRKYVERRWQISALEETTGMLGQTMLGSGRVPEPAVEQITSVLGRADLAKFAKHRPWTEVARADITEVREIVRSTRLREEVAEDATPDAAVASPAG